MYMVMPDTSKAGFVYAIYDGARYKIGHGINVERRLRQLQTGSSKKLEIYAKRHFDNRYKAEKIIHEILSGYRRAGTEWFNLDRQGKRIIDIIFLLEKPTDIERDSLRRLGL